MCFSCVVCIFGIDISLNSSMARFIILTVLAFGLSGCEVYEMYGNGAGWGAVGGHR